MSAIPHTARPGPASGLRWAELDGGVLLVEGGTEQVHLLNPLAGAIFALCDGEHRVEEIVAELAGAVEPGAVRTWIAEGLAAGYLVARGADTAEEMDLGALRELSTRLREGGEFGLALRVRERVTTLAPGSADDWLEIGELAHVDEQRSIERRAYERYLELVPDDPEIAHLLGALRDDPPPARASDACILHLYRRFAPDYDRSMGDDLAYVAPDRLAEVLVDVLGEPAGALDVLDLGCGTGLSGERLRPWAKRLRGIDLSPDMVRRATERGVYDAVEAAEITSWLAARGEALDLVVACDVLIYFGELDPVFERVRRALRPGGHFAFTLERHDGSGWRLSDSGRYAHSATCVRELASRSGFDVERLDEVVLRREYGEDVIGLRAVLA